jgi:UDP-glucose 4-epimerase
LNVLLTGGLGYIGSHTAVLLIEAGHKVVLYDNLVNSSKEVLKNIKLIAGSSVEFVQGDVRDTKLLVDTMASYNIDAVIHFAGLKSVGESVEDPIDYYSNNVEGSISLVQAMRAKNIKILVFSSSATVYGIPKYLPIDENHPTSCNNPYGRTKLHIEEMLADLALSDPIWKIVNLRYFNPVGAHESGLIGELPNGRPNNIMPFITQVASGLRSELNVFGDDYETVDGSGVRDYIHVMDLAEGHLAALNYLHNENTASGCHDFNLGTGTPYSVIELLNSFVSTTGQNIPYSIAPRRQGDVAICYADIQKSKKLLHWVAKRNLSEMCASAWKFQSSIEINK